METLYRNVNTRITLSHLSTIPAYDCAQVATLSSCGSPSVILVQRKRDDQVTKTCNRLCQCNAVSEFLFDFDAV